MRGKALMAFAAATVVLAAGLAFGVESSLVQLERADKAILVPSSEMGEVAIYASAEPVTGTASRYRYTYRVLYREGFPSEYPFSTSGGDGAVPVVGLKITGDPDCDFSGVAGPRRREQGPWRWGVPVPGTLAYFTPSRDWSPQAPALVFTFSSACAPGVGGVEALITHEEDAGGAYSLGSRIMTPMKPPVRTSPGAAPRGAGSYARPPRRR